MAECRLSPEAERDLLDIFLYGLEQFGFNQSKRYHEALRERFQELAAHPLRFPAVEHIRRGYRRSVCGSHSIYYRIEGQDVVIVRILGRQDVNAAL